MQTGQKLFPWYIIILLLSAVLAIAGCSTRANDPATVARYLAPVPDGATAAHTPAFIVKEPQHQYNRIGSPAIRPSASGKPVAIVDPEQPTLFFETTAFTTPRGTYRNLVYRVHFPEVPFFWTSPNLTAGKNPGLLIIYTLDDQDRLLLVTTVHTCGCYLAFLPTPLLDRARYPADWPEGEQSVFGYRLPARAEPPGNDGQRLAFTLESQTHRIGAVDYADPGDQPGEEVAMHLAPMRGLHALPFELGVRSFFETSGPRNGYVRNNTKILERLLISWWAFDWRVGEDKAFGGGDTSPAIFYTSLKFWARKASDMKDFPKFLAYWGWGL